MDVAIRELKAQLSEYVRRATAGELITVTDRGRPVATLGPLLGDVDLDDAVAQGWVTPAARGGLGPSRRRHTSPGTIAAALTEDRG